MPVDSNNFNFDGIPRLLRKGRYKDIATLTGSVVGGKRSLTRQAVSSILRGKVGYSKSSLERIAMALNVSPGWLANWIDSVNESDKNISDGIANDTLDAKLIHDAVSGVRMSGGNDDE